MTGDGHVVVAPDTFKGSLPAADVARALARGVRRSRPDLGVVELPVADGGEGTVDALVAAGFERVDAVVAGPTGRPVEAGYARRGRLAVVEMAAASGLGRLPGGQLAPLAATSRGTGELLRAAVLGGAGTVVLAVGGSASTDGGAGLVQGLGGRVLDATGADVPPGGAGLTHAAGVDLEPVADLLGDVSVVLASDVDNPLLGPAGAAAVYGPQKGATAADVELLDAALARWADLVATAVGGDHRAEAGAGAAGGVGFAALAALRATRRSGVDVVLDLVGADEVLRGASVVVVGEGSLDTQSLRGKAPVGVARRARAAGARVVAVCGRREVGDAELRAVGIDRALALTDYEPDPAVCMARAAELLERAGDDLAGALLA